MIESDTALPWKLCIVMEIILKYMQLLRLDRHAHDESPDRVAEKSVYPFVFTQFSII